MIPEVKQRSSYLKFIGTLQIKILTFCHLFFKSTDKKMSMATGWIIVLVGIVVVMETLGMYLATYYSVMLLC